MKKEALVLGTNNTLAPLLFFYYIVLGRCPQHSVQTYVWRKPCTSSQASIPKTRALPFVYKPSQGFLVQEYHRDMGWSLYFMKPLVLKPIHLESALHAAWTTANGAESMSLRSLSRESWEWTRTQQAWCCYTLHQSVLLSSELNKIFDPVFFSR